MIPKILIGIILFIIYAIGYIFWETRDMPTDKEIKDYQEKHPNPPNDFDW